MNARILSAAGLFLSFSILTGAVCLEAADAPAAANATKKAGPSAETLKLIKDAQNAARTNDPDKTAKACELVQKAADATPAQRMNAYFDLARVLSGKARFDDAAAVFDKAYALNGLTPAEKLTVLKRKAEMFFRSNFNGAFASYHTEGIDKAAEIYRAIAESADTPNLERIAAYSKLADCFLEKMDTKTADSLLETARKLKDLTPAELAEADLNYFICQQRQLKYKEALAGYDKLYAGGLLNKNVNAKKKLENRILDCMKASGASNAEIEKRLASFGRSLLDLADFQSKNGEIESARKNYEAFIKDTKNAPDQRARAVIGLCTTYAGEPLEIMKIADRDLIPIVKENPKYYHYVSRLTGWDYRRAGALDDPKYQQWVTERQLENPSINPRDKIKLLQSLCSMDSAALDFNALKKNLDSLLEVKELTPDLRTRCRLMQVLIDSKGSANGILGKINNVIQTSSEEKVTLRKQADLLLEAGKIAMEMKFFDIAKLLDAEREKMMLHNERRSIPCTFLANGPKDITAFLNSPYFKDRKNHGVLDRKYGKNLQFLLDTDAALTGRVVTKKEEGKEFNPTTFVSSCDEDGLKFFFFAPSDKAKDIADGLAQMGGFEIYLASGPESPYHCYLIDPPPTSRMGSDFPTQYNNADFRRSLQSNNTVKIDFEVLDDGVAMLLQVPWEIYFNQLPSNGTKWLFEALHWEQGGYSWGGSDSVHNPSTFGEIVFANLTPENLNAIKRRIAVKAAKVYRRALSASNGFLERWKDPELGDREFYFAEVKALEDRLSSYLPMLKSGMSSADVDLLFREAVPEWMNIDFILAAKRKEWLDKKRTAGE